MVRNLRRGGMSKREEGYDLIVDERKRRLKIGGDPVFGTREIWELLKR